MTTRKPYRLSDFDFDLPSELIAQAPAPERSGSRLLHVAGARLVDLGFGALPELLVPGDLLVFNDTRVVRSRIVGRKRSGGRVELMLERIVAAREAWMQLRASHPPRIGATIDLPGGASATVCERDEGFVADLHVTADLSEFQRVWAGRSTWDAAIRSGHVTLDGPRPLVRAFPRWFTLSHFVSRPC